MTIPAKMLLRRFNLSVGPRTLCVGYARIWSSGFLQCEMRLLECLSVSRKYILLSLSYKCIYLQVHLILIFVIWKYCEEMCL